MTEAANGHVQLTDESDAPGRPGRLPTPPDRTRHDAVALLRAAAFELFVARGYRNVTVEEIADRAGVSARTFYRRFGTKESVVFWDLETASAEVLAAVDAQPHGATPSELVVGAMTAFAQGRQPVDEVDVVRANIRAVVSQQHDALRPHFESIFAGIEDGLAERFAERFGGEPSDPSVRAGAAWMAATVKVAALSWVDAEGDVFAAEIAGLFVNLGAALEICLRTR